MFPSRTSLRSRARRRFIDIATAAKAFTDPDRIVSRAFDNRTCRSTAWEILRTESFVPVANAVTKQFISK
jgi:putative aminopeptidase FrvX